MSDEDKKVVEKEKAAREDKNLDPEIQARDIKWRAQAKALADENESIKAASLKEKADLLGKIENSAKYQQDLQKKLIDAELKAVAIAAGIKDLDFIKMIDPKSFVIKDDGTIDGIEKAVSDLKTSKPLLFGAEKKFSSSKGETLPEGEKTAKVDAFALSDTEYMAQKARLGL